METWLCILLHVLYVCGVGYCVTETGNSVPSTDWDTGQNRLESNEAFLQPDYEFKRMKPEMKYQRIGIGKRVLDSIRFRAGIGLGKRLSLLKELEKNIQTTADLISHSKDKLTNDLLGTKDMFSKITSKFPPYSKDWRSALTNPKMPKSKIRARLPKAETFQDRRHLDPVVYWIGIGR